MRFKSGSLSGLFSIVMLTTLLTNLGQAAPLKLYNSQGRILSDQDIERIQARANEPFLINPELAKGADPKYFSVVIQSFSNLTSYSPEMVDLTRSYLGLIFGNTRYQEFLSDFKEATTQNTVFQLSLRFSLVPVILSSSVKSKAHTEINAKAEEVRAQYTAAAALKIHQQVAALVGAGKLNPAQGEVMEAKFFGSAKLQIDSQVDLAKSKSIATIDQHIDKIEQEATFQEVAFRFGHKLFQNENGALLLFGQVGKAAIDGGLGASHGLNGMTPMAWWAPRGLSVQGTGQVQVGLEWITSRNLKVGIETYFFHERDPAISGNQFVTNLIYASEADFKEQSKFWKINSNMQKFYVKVPSRFASVEDQFYVTTASLDGKRATAAGGLVRILPQVSIQVDSTFNTPQFDYAISEALLFHATDRLSFYLVNENIKNLKSVYDRDSSGQPAQLSSAAIGVSYRIVDVLLVGLHTTVDVNAECRDFYERDHSSIEDGVGCGGGLMINAQY